MRARSCSRWSRSCSSGSLRSSRWCGRSSGELLFALRRRAGEAPAELAAVGGEAGLARGRRRAQRGVVPARARRHRPRAGVPRGTRPALDLHARERPADRRLGRQVRGAARLGNERPARRVPGLRSLGWLAVGVLDPRGDGRRLRLGGRAARGRSEAHRRLRALARRRRHLRARGRAPSGRAGARVDVHERPRDGEADGRAWIPGAGPVRQPRARARVRRPDPAPARHARRRRSRSSRGRPCTPRRRAPSSSSSPAATTTVRRRGRGCARSWPRTRWCRGAQRAGRRARDGDRRPGTCSRTPACTTRPSSTCAR